MPKGVFERPPVSVRFWKKVVKGDGCWTWKGAHTRDGYGNFNYNDKTSFAHRFAYEDTRGTIPVGLVIDHLCRNTGCVNPDHMEAVTQRENTLRGITPAAVNAKKTHCKRGHPLSGDNLGHYKSKSGRYCKACQKENLKRHRLTTTKQAEKALAEQTEAETKTASPEGVRRA